jgi:hypothetical protein
MPEGVVAGRIIHVPLDNGECRPGIIVKVWPDEVVNALVFLDGSNDGATNFGMTAEVPGAMKWVTSISYDPKTVDERHWHWPQDSH